MKDLQKILVGLDYGSDDGLTEGSIVAARRALWLSGRTGAEVEFLHSNREDQEDPDSSRPRDNETARHKIEELIAEVSGRAAVTGLTIVGERPWVALIQRALAGAADLIVVAKRNHSQHDDRKLGSVSMKLVHNCPVPVWVVKPEHTLQHECVLAATDLSPVGDLATEYAAFIAQADDCRLCAVHAWQIPMELQMSAARIGSEETAKRKKEISDAALKHIQELPSFAALGNKGEVFLACDTPSHAILQLAARENPDLAVMGTISRGGLAGMLVGNTAEKLLYRLDCSLLTVKPEGFICPIQSEPLPMEQLPLRASCVE